MDLLLRLHLADLLVIDLLRFGFGHRLINLEIEISVAQRAALVIFHPPGEVFALVEIVGPACRGDQLGLDQVLQQNLLAIFGREVGEPRPEVRGGIIEIGLLDLDAVDAGDDGIVGGRGRREGKAGEGCCHEQRD